MPHVTIELSANVGALASAFHATAFTYGWASV